MRVRCVLHGTLYTLQVVLDSILEKLCLGIFADGRSSFWLKGVNRKKDQIR